MNAMNPLHLECQLQNHWADAESMVFYSVFVTFLKYRIIESNNGLSWNGLLKSILKSTAPAMYTLTRLAVYALKEMSILKTYRLLLNAVLAHLLGNFHCHLGDRWCLCIICLIKSCSSWFDLKSYFNTSLCDEGQILEWYSKPCKILWKCTKLKTEGVS